MKQFRIKASKEHPRKELSQLFSLSLPYLSQIMTFSLFNFTARKVRHEVINNLGGLVLVSI